ncbi:dual specificity protein phosphatase PHS1-like [Euphorbia lathyris]|uniref:dual specificity protein phosphatase PHS1-like n=1 Tax=Euphorbia lathyris TaxID=212925 RepID=UPI00331404BE
MRGDVGILGKRNETTNNQNVVISYLYILHIICYLLLFYQHRESAGKEGEELLPPFNIPAAAGGRSFAASADAVHLLRRNLGKRDIEVTVNSGGVLFFAIFNQSRDNASISKDAAAVIKFSSSRMATQSERLGFEFAKWLGVQTPQARVIHNCSSEWLQIKEAAERARATSTSEGDKIGEVTCSELLEALDLSRCLLLMSYIHGSPLLESSNAFKRETAEKTAAALGRVLLLDLVIRNEDRLSCRQLGWRGNPNNLLLADKMITANDSILSELLNFQIVAIDSGVPHRPPSGKRTNDHANYPKLVELLLNNYGYSSNLLYDITGGRLGSPPLEDANINGVRGTEITSVVHH